MSGHKNGRGITFITEDGTRYHTGDNWDLMTAKITVTPPEPITHQIHVPGRRNPIDATEQFYGTTLYDMRTMSNEMTRYCATPEEWERIKMDIYNTIGGKRVKIMPDTDGGFYYTGRPVIASEWLEYGIAGFTLEALIEPYKARDIQADDDWLWDDFSFENGIIEPDLSAVLVQPDGTETVTYYSLKDVVIVPYVTASKTGTYGFNGHNVYLTAGVEKAIEQVATTDMTVNIEVQGDGILKFSLREESL